MNQAEWLASENPAAMLEWAANRERFRSVTKTTGPQGMWPPASDRKLRLFAVACCRAVWDGTPCPICKGDGDGDPKDDAGARDECRTCHGSGRVGGLTDPRSRWAVETAERYADGDREGISLVAAHREALQSATKLRGDNRAEFLAFAASAPHFEYRTEWFDAVPRAVQSVLLRDIFNPFRRYAWASNNVLAVTTTEGPCTLLDDSWLAWNDGAVRKMAAAIYDGRRFADLPLLADALSEAGCEDEAILMHCREVYGPHAADCFVCRTRRPGGKCPHCIDGVYAANFAGRAVPCDACARTGRVLAATHVRGCWALDLLLGLE